MVLAAAAQSGTTFERALLAIKEFNPFCIARSSLCDHRLLGWDFEPVAVAAVTVASAESKSWWPPPTCHTEQ